MSLGVGIFLKTCIHYPNKIEKTGFSVNRNLPQLHC